MLANILLAAGQGTRMQSKKQKILHEVGGRPMVLHAFEAAAAVADLKPVLIVAPGESGIADLIGDRADYAVQAEALGTGHAARIAEPLLRGRADQLLVTYADMPLLRAATMRQLAQLQAESGAAVAMLSVDGEPASTFGRVVRDDNGRVLEIVEVAEARRRPDAGALLALREQNVGVYCFEAGWFWQHVAQLPLRQARGSPEYYLTDMVGMAVTQALLVEAIMVDDADECLGAGTRPELVAVERAFRRRAVSHWLGRGVTFIDPDTAYIDQEVNIGQDTVIWPQTYLQGNTVVGEECVLGPNIIIRDAQIGDGCHIEQTVIEKRTIPARTRLGPFANVTAAALPRKAASVAKLADRTDDSG
jgi:bifunctional UDP-N-acetylglucosamine pyrophosphorylase / glucosamine-1-phosphate N-acetyltransferase